MARKEVTFRDEGQSDLFESGFNVLEVTVTSDGIEVSGYYDEFGHLCGSFELTWAQIDEARAKVGRTTPE